MVMSIMIYAILSTKKNPGKLNALLTGIKGVSGVGLYAISVDKIALVVCDINKADIIADKSCAIEYAGVIETLAQQFTLLPVRYGSVMESADAIKKMLERNYAEIQQNLLKVENKFEFGLKVFCDSQKIKDEIKTETESIIEPEQSSENSIYREYINKKFKEHKFEELLLAHVDEIILDITTRIAQLNPTHKFKKMVSPTNIIDAVFLLEKDKKKDCINVVNNLQNKYPGLRLILTGPWPPYNFVDIIIK